MASIQIPSGESPVLQINNVGGSLQVKSWGEDSIRIEVQHQEHLDYSFEDNMLDLSCDSDCLLRVPEDSATQIDSVGGDAYVLNVEGAVSAERIGGSLTLKNVGATTLKRISGNLTARNVEGDLSVAEVSGNCSLRDIEGEVNAEKVAGNLSLRNVEGNIEARSNGNADLRLEMPDDSEVRIKAGGNVFCHLESSTDADVILASGAQQIHIYTADNNKVLQTAKHEFTLGEGGAIVEITAGGHIDFRCRDIDEELLPDMNFVDDLTGLADEITGQVTAQMEDQMEALNEKLQALGERLKQTGSQAGARAQRRVEAAQRRLERKLQGRGIRSHGRTVTVTHGGKVAEPVSSKERGLILQMVQEKKINVDEAEMLLNTLEGRIAPIQPVPPVAPVPPIPPVPPVAPIPPVPPVESKDKED
ncbi:MAG: hypothetical protein WEC16_00945 [Anaerolineales bacterium]